MHINDFIELSWFVIHLKAVPHHWFDAATFWDLGVRGFQAVHLRAHKEFIEDLCRGREMSGLGEEKLL